MSCVWFPEATSKAMQGTIRLDLYRVARASRDSVLSVGAEQPTEEARQMKLEIAK